MEEKEDKQEEIIEDKTSDQAELKEAETILLKGYIEKEYPNIGNVKIYHPTIEIETEIDEAYTNEFNKLLKENKNIPTMTELEEILEERGSWNNEYEDKIDKYRDSIQRDYTDIAKLKSKQNKNNKKEIQLQIENFQKNIFKSSKALSKLIAQKSRLFDGTIESMVEKHLIKLKLVRCIKTEKDKPKWNSIDELDQEFGTYLMPLIRDAQKFWAGMEDPLFEESLAQALGDLDTKSP